MKSKKVNYTRDYKETVFAIYLFIYLFLNISEYYIYTGYTLQFTMGQLFFVLLFF